MSLSQYNIYLDSRKQLDELCKGERNFDVLSHNQNENTLFHSYYHKIYSSAISTIVFQAFAVEAYINFYGTKKLGKGVFHEHYDRINIKDKIIIVSRIATGKDFPKGEKVYELVKKLFSQRDKLVHHKGHGINFKECTQESFQNTMYGNIEFVLNDIDNLVNTYPMFINTLAALEGKQLDLYTEQQTELVNELQMTIVDTMKKAFGGNSE